MAAGRPKKYTARTLAKAVERYFAEISYTMPLRGEDGRPLRNGLGDEISVQRYAAAPSITALCLRLGIDRGTWASYARAPETAEICREAKTKVEAFLEQELVTRDKNVQGVIFSLQNNYGWKQKEQREVVAQVSSGVEGYLKKLENEGQVQEF